MTGKKKAPRKHGRRYPWKDWFQSGRFKLKRGQHFDIRTDSMAQVARQAARKMQPRVPLSIEVAETYVIITVLPETARA